MHGAFPFHILSSSLGQCRAGFERIPENLNPHGAVPLLHILQHGIATRSSRGELDSPIVAAIAPSMSPFSALAAPRTLCHAVRRRRSRC